MPKSCDFLAHNSTKPEEQPDFEELPYARTLEYDMYYFLFEENITSQLHKKN